MANRTPYIDAIKQTYSVPDYIRAIANACKYDLRYGPTWIKIPQSDIALVNDDCVVSFYDDAAEDMDGNDLVQETYNSIAAEALREFIAELPSEVWVDCDCDYVNEVEPDQYEEYENDNGEIEMQEVCFENIWHVEHKQIVAALFGEFFAKEFN